MADPGVAEQSSVRSYLGWGLAATVLCFLPTGLVALFFGLQVSRSVDEDRLDDARRQSRLARRWLIATVAVGAGIYLLIVAVLLALGAFSA